MRFKMDRLCELAGIQGASRRGSGVLREGASHEKEHNESYHDNRVDELYEEDDEEKVKGKKEGTYAMEEMHHDHMDELDEDEVLEISEVDLVNELRRARSIMQEAKKKSKLIKRKRKENLQEMQLRAVIDQEVKNVLRDLNLNSGWVYGNRRPTKSRQGYTHQGSLLKGIGFK